MSNTPNQHQERHHGASSSNELHSPLPLKGLSNHCEEVDELMDTLSPWPLRCGIWIIAAALLALLATSWFIRLPEDVNIPCTLIPTHTSSPVYSPCNGELSQLVVRSGQSVTKGDTLAIIQSDASSLALLAPRNGVAEANIRLTPGCDVLAKQELFIIFPPDMAVIGIIKLPASQISQVKAGHKISISLTTTSASSSIAATTGCISEIAQFPNADGSYSARVSFDSNPSPCNLLTPTPLNATATIRLQDKRLIEHIWTKQ